MVWVDLHLLKVSKEQFDWCCIVRIRCTDNKVGANLLEHRPGGNACVVSSPIEDQNGPVSYTHLTLPTKRIV